MVKLDKKINAVIWAGVLIIAVAILISAFFSLTLTAVLIMGWILTFFYSLFAFIMLRQPVENSTQIEVKEVVKEIEKPVYIEKKVEKPVYLDKPIYVEKKVYVDKPVYIEKKRKKLNIPKYDFVASTETKTYHTRNCRLGKLIKRKYKLSSNRKSDFTKKKFKACKVCIRKIKKV